MTAAHFLLVLLILPGHAQNSLAIHAEYKGYHKTGAWALSVDTRGFAQLTCCGGFKKETTTFRVSPAQLAELERVIKHERFFALPNEVGDSLTIDGDLRTVEIRLGKKKYLVTIHNYEAQKLSPTTLAQMRKAGQRIDPEQEMKRAVRVWQVIESWVNHPQAAASSIRDEHLLKSP